MNPPLRVLVTAFAPVPGANPHTDALLGMAAALQGEIDLVTVKAASLAHVEQIRGGRMFRVPVGGGNRTAQAASFSRAIARQLEAETYDVVHARGPIEGEVVSARRSAHGFRFVYELCQFPDEAEGHEAEQAWLAAHERCLASADLVLAPSTASGRYLGDQGLAGKTLVVHPGVDVDTFDWWPTSNATTIRLLYLGSMAADRDIATLIGAVRRVAKTRAVRMLMAGEPNALARDRIRRMVEAFGLSGQIEVRGEPRPASIPGLIHAADIVLVTASGTPRFQVFGDLPQPLLEPLSCRRPVIVAGVPGIAELVRDEKEGLHYPPGDDAGLADAITSLARDAELAMRLAEQGYEHVRRNYSSAARRRRIAEVYEMLAPGSQRYDAWEASFDQEVTGLLETPSALLLDPSPPSDEITVSTIIEEVADYEEAQHLGSDPPPTPSVPTLDTNPEAVVGSRTEPAPRKPDSLPSKSE